MNRTTSRRIGAAAVSGLVLLGVAGPALANDADVIRRGGCSHHSDWKLKASPEDGRIEVEGEVDSNIGGQNWKWKMLHNGNVSARGSATTGGRSGSFEVRRLMVNSKGDDKIGWRAKNPASGEVCRGSLTF
jgi:hypothetical protein